MARRIVIACEHGKTERHLTRELPTAVSNEGWCEGGRVLDPNSFVDEVAHAVMAWTWTIDAVPDMESPIEGLDLANRILDALAGSEG